MGLTVLPRNEDGNLGRDKTDLDNVPELDHYVPSTEYNNLVDRVCELGEAVGLADGSTPGSLEERVGSLETGGSLLWEWNGVDTSQFEASDAYLESGWTTALSVVANATVKGGNVLRYQRSAGSGGVAMRLILASEFTIPESGCFVIEVVQHQISVANRYGGVCHHADPNGGSLYAFGEAWGASGKALRVEDGVNASGSSTNLPNIGLLTGRVLITIEGDKVAGVEPRFSSVAHHTGEAGFAAEMWRQDQSARFDSVANDAGWTSTTPNRCGLSLFSPGGGTGSYDFDIAAFRILKHPRDN